jgi:energy-coupling factor transport system substrate-specific component
MFSGAQVSLYPMSDDFVGIILGALGALDPWRDRLRIETDDVSTLIVGPPEILFPAMRDLFVAAAATGVHCTMHATVSRGCPGEPDDPICTPRAARRPAPRCGRIAAAREAVSQARATGQVGGGAALALSARPRPPHGRDLRLHRVPQGSGTFERSKNFCTKLRGDAGPVFETLSRAFTGFRRAGGACRARRDALGQQPDQGLTPRPRARILSPPAENG